VVRRKCCQHGYTVPISSVLDPDPALFSVGFTDSNQKKISFLSFSATVCYIYISGTRSGPVQIITDPSRETQKNLQILRIRIRYKAYFSYKLQFELYPRHIQNSSYSTVRCYSNGVRYEVTVNYPFRSTKGTHNRQAKEKYCSTGTKLHTLPSTKFKKLNQSKEVNLLAVWIISGVCTTDGAEMLAGIGGTAPESWNSHRLLRSLLSSNDKLISFQQYFRARKVTLFNI